MKTATLKLTAAIGIAGNLLRAGTIVEVPEAAAKNLLHRGKAVLATAADEDEGGDDFPDLSKMSKAKLLEVAQRGGIVTVDDSNTKGEITEAIEAAMKAREQDQAE